MTIKDSSDKIASAPSKDFRHFLQSELLRRCQKNKKYSLRAFARALSVEPSFLSKILRGGRSTSPELIVRLGAQLGLSPVEVQHYLEETKRQKVRALGLAHLASEDSLEAETFEFQAHALDQFQIISDWYHYAILELITVDGFNSSPKWISQKLGITQDEAKNALDRLLRLNYLRRNEDGRLSLTHEHNTTLPLQSEFTAGAFRKLQRQILEKAIHALEDLPINERDQTSMTLAMNSKQIPEAKEMIRKFRRRFCAHFQGPSQVRDAVFHLGISLYPITQGGTDES